MRNFKRSVLVAALLPLLSPATWALGLGEMTMRSYLNEPLKAEVALLDVNGLNAEDIRIRLATAEDFSRMGVERAYFLTSVQFTVEIDDSGRGRVLLTTTEPLLEPYVDLILETRWPAGRLLREYTVLVDLPDMNRTELMASSRQTIAQQATPPKTTPQKTQPQPRQAVSKSPSNREYGRDAKALPTPGERYLVEKNDTLWEIAARGRPAGATVEQTMVATVEMNPQAFNAGNINGLKAGYVLYMPAEDDIRLSNLDALSAVSQQNQDWRDGVRRQPALRVVADNELSDAGQRVESAAEEAASVALSDREAVAPEGDAPKDDLDQVSDAADAQVDTSELSRSINGDAPTEAASPDLVLIQQRLSQLSDQVENMRELVTLKDEQIASLQQQLAAQSAVQPVNVAAATPAAESRDEGLPWWVYVLGGVVLLAAGGAFVARRADREVQRNMVQALGVGVMHKIDKEQIPLKTAPVDEASEPTDKAPEVEQDGERGYGRKLHNAYAQENPIADAIAEADIYIAYGRYQQALDLLAAATKAEPGHAQGFLKMLEIYLKNDRREEAEALLPSITQTGNTEAQLAAEAMLNDYRAPQIAAKSLGELADAALAAVPAPATPSASGAPDPVLDDTLDFDLVAPAAEAREAVPAHDALSTEVDLASLDGRDEAVSDVELDLADWGDDALESASEDVKQPTHANGKLPPELAAVLGSDIPPPAVEHVPDDEDGQLIYGTEANPVETKLDLARAYLDMGDEDGARPVLEEVISEGDLQQQAQARELLLRIE